MAAQIPAAYNENQNQNMHPYIQQQQIISHEIIEESVHVEPVRKIDKIQYNGQISNMRVDKGMPVFNMLPDFRRVRNDPKWAIAKRRISDQRQIVRNKIVEEQAYQMKKRANQEQILRMIQQIEEQADQVEFRKQNFNMDYID